MVEQELHVQDQWSSHDIPFEVRLHGQTVKFEVDVMGRVRATCPAFPDMLVSHSNFAYAVRLARSEVLRLKVESGLPEAPEV